MDAQTLQRYQVFLSFVMARWMDNYVIESKTTDVQGPSESGILDLLIRMCQQEKEMDSEFRVPVSVSCFLFFCLRKQVLILTLYTTFLARRDHCG